MLMKKYKQVIMRKFDQYLNENVEIENFEKQVLDSVKTIIMQEKGISEKNFNYIRSLNVSFDKFMLKIRENVDYYKDMKIFIEKRKSYAAEFFYDKYFEKDFEISLS